MKMIFPLFAVLFLAGCTTAFVSPNSQALPDNHVALIKAGHSGADFGVWSSIIRNVYGIKGQVAPQDGGRGNYKSVRLLPGKYTLYLSCHYDNLKDVTTSVISSNDVSVDVDAQAGMTYVVSCKFIKHNRIIGIVAGSYKTGGQMNILPVNKTISNTDAGNQENLDDLKGLVSPEKN